MGAGMAMVVLVWVLAGCTEPVEVSEAPFTVSEEGLAAFNLGIGVASPSLTWTGGSVGQVMCELDADGQFLRGPDMAGMPCAEYWAALWARDGAETTTVYSCWALDKCSGRVYPAKPPA